MGFVGAAINSLVVRATVIRLTVGSSQAKSFEQPCLEPSFEASQMVVLSVGTPRPTSTMSTYNHKTKDTFIDSWDLRELC